MRISDHGLVRLLAWFWIIGPVSVGAAEDDPALRERFLKEYPAALGRLRETYSRVHGSGRETREAAAKSGPRKKMYRVTFEVDGENRKFQKDVLIDGDKEPGKSRVTTSTPSGTFTADRKKPGAPPTLSRMDNGGDPASTRALDNFLDTYVNVSFIYLKSKPEIFRAPHPGLKSVTWDEKDGRKFVKVRTTKSVEVPYGPTKTYTMDLEETQWLSPEEDWALHYEQRSSRTKAGADDLRTITIEYGDRADHARRIKRVTETAMSHGKVVNTVGFEFDEFVFGPSPAADFTTQAVGLPDLKVPVATRRNDWPVLLIGAAVLFAAAAIVLRVRRRGAV